MDPKRADILRSALCDLDNADPTKYWKDVLPGARPPFPKSWCGAAVLYWLHSAGICSDLQWVIGKGFLYNLPQTTNPQPGDVAYLDKPFQHHCLVVSADEDTVKTIDGNSRHTDTIGVSRVVLRTRKRNEFTAFYSIDGYCAYP
jgi:hypothetical protein